MHHPLHNDGAIPCADSRKEQNVPSLVPGLVPSNVPSSSPNISRVLSFLPLACPTMKEADLTKALKILEKWFAPKHPFFKKLESYFA
jgi:hypothetical protein